MYACFTNEDTEDKRQYIKPDKYQLGMLGMYPRPPSRAYAYNH